MQGRLRNAMNAQIWRQKNDPKYDSKIHIVNISAGCTKY